MGGGLPAVADDGKAVIDGLVAATLDLIAEKVVDEGGLAGREGAQHRDQGPPGNLGSVGLVGGQQSHGVGYLVEGAETLDRAQEDGVLLGEMGFEVFELLFDGVRGGRHGVISS